MSEVLRGARSKGRRFPFAERCEMYVVSVEHESGTWESIYCRTEAQAQAIEDLVEQFDALKLAATRQLTPLDVAATHIAIIRSKGDDYTASERDNVAVIVESHVKEARAALFDAISNPARACTCLAYQDGLNQLTGKVLLNKNCPVHGDAS